MVKRAFPNLSPVEEVDEARAYTRQHIADAPLTVAALFAERDKRRRHDQEVHQQLQRQREGELVEYRKRLDNFQLTDAIIQSGRNRIRRAFDRGE